MMRWLSRILGIFHPGEHRMESISRETRRFAGNIMREQEYERQHTRRRLEQTNETLEMLRTQVAAITGGDDYSDGNR
jgi:hypothetical protein